MSGDSGDRNVASAVSPPPETVERLLVRPATIGFVIATVLVLGGGEALKLTIDGDLREKVGKLMQGHDDLRDRVKEIGSKVDGMNERYSTSLNAGPRLDGVEHRTQLLESRLNLVEHGFVLPDAGALRAP